MTRSTHLVIILLAWFALTVMAYSSIAGLALFRAISNIPEPIPASTKTPRWTAVQQTELQIKALTNFTFFTITTESAKVKTTTDLNQSWTDLGDDVNDAMKEADKMPTVVNKWMP